MIKNVRKRILRRGRRRFWTSGGGREEEMNPSRAYLLAVGLGFPRRERGERYEQEKGGWDYRGMDGERGGGRGLLSKRTSCRPVRRVSGDGETGREREL